MAALPPSRRRLFQLGIRRPNATDAVDWEIEHYLAEQTDRLMAQGLSADQARKEAERRFGDISRYRRRLERNDRRKDLQERISERILVMASVLASAVRFILRNPGFAAVVTLTLALGIGANAALFGIVDRLLLSPPKHVVDPGAVRRIVISTPSGETNAGVSPPEAADIRRSDGFQAVASYYDWGKVAQGIGPEATEVRALLVDAWFLPLLGTHPFLGRAFRPEEDGVGVDRVAILSYEHWTRAFGADPAVLGRTVQLDGSPWEIIGIMPAGFSGVNTHAIDVLLPLHAREFGWRRVDTHLTAIARLNPGMDPKVAEANATALFRAGTASWEPNPMFPGHLARAAAAVSLAPLLADRHPDLASASARVARWLGGLSLLVLMTACLNVANLFLGLGARRKRESGVRLALGISRRRLVAEGVVTSVLLALTGATLALLLARLGGSAVQRFLPDVLFPGGLVTMRVALYALVVATLLGFTASIAPALQGVQLNLADGLKTGRSESPPRSWLQRSLVSAQAAICAVLLVGAGLFVSSLGRVLSVDLGIEVDRVLTTEINWAGNQAARATLLADGVDFARRLPVVEAAAASEWEFTDSRGCGTLVRPGTPPDTIPHGQSPCGVTPDFFRAMGLRIQVGRGFDAGDGPDAPRVMIVSRSLAEALTPGGDVLGECLLSNRVPGGGCATIVGIVDDASYSAYSPYDWMGDRFYRAAYFPAAQTRANGALYIRVAEGHGGAVVEELARYLRESPAVRYAAVRSIREVLDPQTRSWRLGASLFSAFGLLALLVASIGLYSVLAFDVASRRREFGIRAAMGAEAARLLRGVLETGARTAGVGVLAGLLIAFVAAPRLGPLLFEVEPRDPAIFIGVALLLLAVALLSSLVPGLHATRADPSEVMRQE